MPEQVPLSASASAASPAPLDEPVNPQKHRKGLSRVWHATGYSIAGQPQMESALSHLQAAEKDLREASHDKGGHRDRALELVNRAEEQVREGMKYDKRH